MRTVHWMFIVAVLMFLSGIGFVIAGARTAQHASASAEPAITVTPVASVKQIMKAIVEPAATAVYDAVQTSVTIKGVQEIAPQNDREWEILGGSAAALVEAGNMMLVGNRVIDTGEWVQMSQAMIEAGKRALQATKEKDTDKILEAGSDLNRSCDNCHRKYQRGA